MDRRGFLGGVLGVVGGWFGLGKVTKSQSAAAVLLAEEMERRRTLVRQSFSPYTVWHWEPKEIEKIKSDGSVAYRTRITMSVPAGTDGAWKTMTKEGAGKLRNELLKPHRSVNLYGYRQGLYPKRSYIDCVIGELFWEAELRDLPQDS